jgi:4'-phosphopantetheinyl transferase
MCHDLEFQDFTSFFNTTEMASISTGSVSFFELWTKKEALLKAIGSGLFTDPLTFSVVGDHVEIGERKFFVKSISFDDSSYKLSFAINRKNAEFVMTELRISDFVSA